MPHSHSTDRTGISRRGFVTLSIAGAGVTAAAMTAPEAAYADEPALAPVVADYPNQIKIAHLSDTHFFSRRLYSDCPDFTIAEHSDRKMFRESGDIIKKAMDEIVAYQPDLVILSGDLTKDGELACHQDIHAMLAAAKKRLKAAGKETQFAVINGNHDINNDLNGRDFSGGFAEHTDLVDPLAFKNLYADCGYDDAIAMFDQGGSKGGSLSYVLRPVKGVTLIAVDSCKYSTDQNGLDVDEHVTSGVVGEKLLQWIESQAKQARAAGDIVFVTQHHGVVPHFSMEPTLMGEYLVDNYEECQRRYADAGVSAVFTGHMHANDIASITTEAGNTLFDIETCATVTYPSDIRFATLGWEREKGSANVRATLALESHPLGSVDYTDFDSGSVTRIPNIEEYGHERLLTVDVVKTMIADALVAPMLDQAAANGGVKPLLAQLAGGLGIGDGTAAALDGALFGAVFGMLPQSADEAFIVEIPILGSAGIWANPENRRVMVQKMEAKAGVEPYALTFDAGAMAAVQSALVSEPMAAAAGWSYYISAESLAKFLVPVYAGLDSLLVSGGRDQVLDLLRTLVETLVNQKVADGANSLFDLIKFAYGDHLHGDETCPAWVETATAQIKLTGDDAEGNPAADGSLTSFLRATINDEVVLGKLGSLLKGIKINLKDLLVKEKGSIAIDIALGAIKDLGAIFGLLGGTPGNMIPNIPTLADLAHGALYSLTHDENQLGDRVNTLATGLVDPDWKPGGGSTGGDGGNGNGGGSGSGNGSTGGGNGNGSNGGNGTGGSGNGDSTGGNGTGGSTGGSGNGGSTGGSGSTGGVGGSGTTGGNGGSSGNGFGTGNGSTSGSGGSAGAITGSGKPSSGKLPQTGDTNTFAAAALMGLSALAAAIHAGSRNEALDSQDTE